MLTTRLTSLLVSATAFAIPLGMARPADASTVRDRPEAKVSTPTVTGPVTGGKGVPTLVSTSAAVLASGGYVAQEYFLAGTATAYEPAKTLSNDGRWKFKPAGTAPYRTRIVVYRPERARDFNGTVYVEWLNVSAAFDTAAVWGVDHTQMMRSGAAWIGVSAQSGGVQGGGPDLIGSAPPAGLRGSDPERYATLTHPGDQYSFDIFSQAGLAAAGDAQGTKPLGNLDAKHVIAVGKSQAAFRLVSYVDGVQPLADVYDGFLIVSRHASGAPLGQTPFGQADASVPTTTLIRTDSRVPVLVLQTEGDLDLRGFRSALARQPDSERFRLWEVAGTAHADAYSGVPGLGDVGDGAAELTLLDPAAASGGPLGCTQPINAGPTFAVQNAAVAHLDRWVRHGTLPPRAPRIKTTLAANGEPVIVRDEHGIAVGGVRTPLVDVPLATNTGKANAGGSFCSLFGTSTPFDATTLAALYPTPADYAAKFDHAADATVKAGFWLRPESDNFKAAASKVSIGGTR